MRFIYAIVNGFVSGISKFAIMCLSILPNSPLKFSDTVLSSQLMSNINWIVPIDKFIKIGGAWVACIAIWYTVSIGLRWAKTIE